MTKKNKIIVFVLFAVIVILAIGITRLYLSASNDTNSIGDTEEIVSRLDDDGSGNRIFEGTNGLYGITDSNGRVIVAPEWTELSFAENQRCIASKRIGGRLLSGCINYDGNIVVPFIYRNIVRHRAGDYTFYIAETEDDASFVIYDGAFNSCFMRAWESCDFDENELLLKSGTSSLMYSVGNGGFVCEKAVIGGEALGCPYELEVSSRVLLSSLDCSMLESIAETVSLYLGYAYSGEWEKLEEKGFARSSFLMLFHEEEIITSRELLGIKDIFIYSDRTETGDRYFTASVTAETKITYKNEEGAFESITEDYRASVRFAASDTGIMPVSGAFSTEAPDYPQHEAPTENTTVQE